MHLASTFVLLLAFAFAGVRSPAAAMSIVSPSEASVGEQALAKQAMSLFAESRFADAARAFEVLAVETSRARYLFNAAVARERLGHEARAYVHLRRFLANAGLSPSERSQGEERLAELIERTVPLRVDLTPSPAGKGVLIFYLLQGAGKRRLPIEIRVAEFGLRDRPDSIELHVEAGTWLVHAEVPGHHPAEGQLTITYPDSGVLALSLEDTSPATKEVQIRLRLSPPAALSAGASARVLTANDEVARVVPLSEPTTRFEIEPGSYQVHVSADGFATQTLELSVEGQEASVDVHLDALSRRRRQKPELIAMGVLGGVALVSGVALLAPTAPKFADLRDGYVDNPFGDGCTSEPGGIYCQLTTNIVRQGAGAGFLGVTGGSALSMGLSTRRTRSSAWIELGVGAAFALGGSIVLSENAKSFQVAKVCKDDPASCTPFAIDRHRVLTVAAGAGLGFGGSLMVGGLMKVLQRSHAGKRPQASTYTLPGGAGVSLSGRF